MAKGKKSGASSGLRKNHGPKRHMHAWCGAMKQDFAKSGLLSKYYDFESWSQACQARGSKHVTYEDFQEFRKLKFEDQKAYFKNFKK